MNTHGRRSLGCLAALCLALALAPAALAGSSVDPTTLNPVPPDIYTCKADGPNTICRASFVNILEGVDDGPLCGDLHFFEWVTEDVDVVRYYDADDNLVRRTRRASLGGVFSLSPTGDAPTIDVVAHFNSVEVFTVPGDLDSGVETQHGLLNHTGGSSAAGFGASLFAAGLIMPDGTFHGLNHDFGTPGANEALCSVLLG